jgi:hypothetical protein
MSSPHPVIVRCPQPDGRRFHHAPPRRPAFALALFFTIGRPISGVICLILQISLIGWIPAAVWAVYSLSQFKTDKKIN